MSEGEEKQNKSLFIPPSLFEPTILFFFLSLFPSCFLAALTSAMIKGCREPPYPSVLTDATMEKLALTKFVSQESHCEVRTTNFCCLT